MSINLNVPELPPFNIESETGGLTDPPDDKLDGEPLGCHGAAVLIMFDGILAFLILL